MSPAGLLSGRAAGMPTPLSVNLDIFQQLKGSVSYSSRTERKDDKPKAPVKRNHMHLMNTMNACFLESVNEGAPVQELMETIASRVELLVSQRFSRCLCESIASIYLLSTDLLLPLVKLSFNLTKDEQEFIRTLIHEFLFNSSQPRQSFLCCCDRTRDPDCVSGVSYPFSGSPLEVMGRVSQLLACGEGAKSVLDIFHMEVMNTYYCSLCDFQCITGTETGPLILDGEVVYLALHVVRSAWCCPRCCTNKYSYLESKIKAPSTRTALVYFTMGGIRSESTIRDEPLSTTNLTTALHGEFRALYLVSKSGDNFKIMKKDHSSRKWKKFGGPTNDDESHEFPRGKDVRAVIWHHTKPYVVARQLLSIKDSWVNDGEDDLPELVTWQNPPLNNLKTTPTEKIPKQTVNFTALDQLASQNVLDEIISMLK